MIRRLPTLFALLITIGRVASGQTTVTDPVVATIGGIQVRVSDLDARSREVDPGFYARLQLEQYELRRRTLDSIVTAYLLESEAKRRGMSVDKLLEQELPKRTAAPSGPDILEAYTRSGLAAQGVSIDQAREAIIQSLSSTRDRSESLRRYVDELKAAASNVVVNFDPPRQAVRVLASDRVAGRPEARVEVVEFGDFQCPICRSTVPALKRLRAEHRDNVRFVWKDFPLNGHPDAKPAAQAARCAADQGRFWEYHDKLFDNQEALGKRRLKDYAKQLKLDQKSFSECLDGGKYARELDAAVEEATTYGVSATPTVFINGRLIVGAVPFETYDRIVREELGRSAQLSQK
jgi:protein-disulfide isomerase